MPLPEERQWGEFYTGPPCPHGQDDPWDCETCSREMCGGWYAPLQTRQGIDWMEQDDPPQDDKPSDW